MAIFTPVSEDEAREFLAAYAVGELVSLTGVPEGVENTNYRLVSDRGAYALTLFEKRVARQDLPFYLGLMAHLAERGYPAPRPERRRDDGFVGELNGRPAALVSWLPGDWPRRPTMSQCEAAGRALAELHLKGADYPAVLPNALGLDGWAKLVARCRTRAQGEAAGVLDRLEAEIEALRPVWPDDLPTGAIHADYFPDNVLFEGDRVSGVIDYYFACTDTLAYDLAITLDAWGFGSEGAPDREAMAALTRGYEAVRRLTPAERAALSRLCRGSSVRFSLTRLHDTLFHDPSWVVTPKDPAPFLRRLGFHQTVTDASVYGAA